MLLREPQPAALPDLIARLHANPLRDGTVLLLLLSKETFDLERLVGRLEERAGIRPRRQPPPRPGAQPGPGRPSRGSSSEGRRLRRAPASEGGERCPQGSPAPPRPLHPAVCLPGIPSQPVAARELAVPLQGSGWLPIVSPWRGEAWRPGDGGGGRGGRGWDKQR